MTESVLAVPSAAPAPAQAVPGNNTAAIDAADTAVSGQFQSTLARQLQGQATPAAEALPVVPGAPVAPDGIVPGTPVVPDARVVLGAPVVPGALVVSGDPSKLQKPIAGDGKPATDKADPDGTALPLTGQILPLDPSLLTVAPPLALPTAELAAALTASVTNVAPESGVKAPPPRLNLTPIADALAKDSATPGQSERAPLDLFTTLAPQHETIAAVHSAALAAELSTQTSALPVSATLPTALTNPLVTSAAPAPNVAVPPNAVPVITIPVAQPGWDQALGQRVQWLVGQQMQGAELRITPPHLGTIEVRISVGHDQQTVVNFTSPHAAVRDAIEAAVPRLRDMLGNNGQDLVNVNVSQHSFAEQRRHAAPSGSGRDHAYPGGLSSVDVMETTSGSAASLRGGSGLVDYFA